METEFPLQYDTRALFQWVAKRQRKGVVVVASRDVQTALDIASKRDFAEMLDELMNCSYLPYPVIEDVQTKSRLNGGS